MRRNRTVPPATTATPARRQTPARVERALGRTPWFAPPATSATPVARAIPRRASARIRSRSIPAAGPFWTDRASLATPRYAPGGVAFGGLTYVFGGCTQPPCGGAFTATVEAYDPAQNSWSPRAPMPTSRAMVAAATIGGTTYVVGGATLNNVPPYSTAVQAYDPALNTWTTKASMQGGRASPAIGAIGGKLYVAGGRYCCSPPVPTPPDFVESYDPATDTWTTRAQAPIDRFAPAYGVIGGKLYVAGGLAPIVRF